MTGETGVRKVFGGGGRPDGDRDFIGTGPAAQLGIGFADGAVEGRLQRGVHDPLADFTADGHQSSDIIDVEPVQTVIDALGQGVVADEFLERIGGGGEASGNRNAQLAEMADHFTQGGVFAADLRQIGKTEVVQPKYRGSQDASPGANSVRIL